MNPTLLQIAGWVIPFLLAAALAYHLRKAKSLADSNAAITARLQALETELKVVATKVSPFWSAVETEIGKSLTHPSPQFREMDKLLVKLKELTINQRERKRLHKLLLERTKSTDPEISDAEKISAEVMIKVMEKVLHEKKEANAAA